MGAGNSHIIYRDASTNVCAIRVKALRKQQDHFGASLQCAVRPSASRVHTGTSIGASFRGIVGEA